MTFLSGTREKFRAEFGNPPESVFRAPGRVNLIGGHVDYNEGFVLPIALDRDCCVLAGLRNNRELHIHSEQFGETVVRPLDAEREGHHWSSYVCGVAWSLARAGIEPSGANLWITSEVPPGSGLSSSAALEVSTAMALLSLAGRSMDRVALARACQRAENEYVGMRCGIMDQLAAACGRQGHALRIDCRTLEVEPVPLDESQVRVVVANTMVKHALASSKYNVRRQECEEAVHRIREHRPEVRALRDVAWQEVEPLAEAWPENIRRRARHITTEIARVPKAAAALRQGDFPAMGRLMLESHASLAADYQVVSAEQDLMVELARELEGFYGARMTGGGFGGCTVNLVRSGDAGRFAVELTQRYQQAAGRRPDVFVCRASDGAGEVPA